MKTFFKIRSFQPTIKYFSITEAKIQFDTYEEAIEYCFKRNEYWKGEIISWPVEYQQFYEFDSEFNKDMLRIKEIKEFIKQVGYSLDDLHRLHGDYFSKGKDSDPVVEEAPKRGRGRPRKEKVG